MARKKPIISSLGQWAYPGEITIIPSSNITMKGVNYPVLGVDNLGNSKVMMPGAEYNFPGDYVTEIPQMGKGGLRQWFAEDWTDIKTGKPCGRSGKEKGSRPYPACRPKNRVNETTPKTTSEMSSAEKAKFKREKTSGKRIDYNHKRRQDGGESYKLPNLLNISVYQEPSYKESDQYNRTGYNPGTGTIYYNPNNSWENIKNPIWLEHERFHHLQHLNQTDHIGSPMSIPPMIASDALMSNYYNRRNLDLNKHVNSIIQKNPQLQFVPKEKLIFGSIPNSKGLKAFLGAEDLMYSDPNTIEGEARKYEDYITNGGKSLFNNGGETWLDQYQDAGEVLPKSIGAYTNQFNEEISGLKDWYEANRKRIGEIVPEAYLRNNLKMDYGPQPDPENYNPAVADSEYDNPRITGLKSKYDPNTFTFTERYIPPLFPFNFPELEIKFINSKNSEEPAIGMPYSQETNIKRSKNYLIPFTSDFNKELKSRNGYIENLAINISNDPVHTDHFPAKNDPDTVMSHEISHYLNQNNPEVFLFNRTKLAEMGIGDTKGYNDFYTKDPDYSKERKDNELLSDAYALKQDMRKKGFYDYTKGEKLTPEIWNKYKKEYGDSFIINRFIPVFEEQGKNNIEQLYRRNYSTENNNEIETLNDSYNITDPFSPYLKNTKETPTFKTSDERIIHLLNQIVKNKDQDLNVAKYGGWLNKYQSGGNILSMGDYDLIMAPKKDNYLLPDINRPSYKDEFGNRRSEYKMGFNIDGKETLIPSVVGGKQLTDDQALERYYKTGLHMGQYNTPEEADYAARLRTARYNMLEDPIRFKADQFQTGGWANWTPNVDKPYMRTSPAGNAGYSDNTRVSSPDLNNRKAAEAAEYAKRVGSISQGKPETAYEKAKRKSSFVEQEKQRTGSAGPLSYVLDAVNPATYGFAATDLIGNTAMGVNNLAKGNFSEAAGNAFDAGMNALYILPAAAELRGPLRSAGKYLTTQTPLKNTYKYNPWAFKANPEAYYHRSPNLNNIINQETGMLQGFGESEAGKLYSELAQPGAGPQVIKNAGTSNEYVSRLNLMKPANSRLYFSKGVPLDYGRTNMILDKTTGRMIPGQGYVGPYIAEVKGVPMGSSTKGRAPGLEPTKIGSYAVSRRPISLDEAKFYKEDWLRGYKPIDVPSAQPSMNLSNIFSTNIAREFLGELLKGNQNRKAIAEGNAWLKNWIDDPITQTKIDTDLGWIPQRSNILKDKFSLGYEQAKSFTPVSKEYPFLEQLNDYLIRRPHIHSGNRGVSYLHTRDPYLRSISEQFNNPRLKASWISRNPSMSKPIRRSTTVHEGTHDWTSDFLLRESGQRDDIRKLYSNDIRNLSDQWKSLSNSGINPSEVMGRENATLGYLADPTEVHARIMQLRQLMKMTPEQSVMVTPEKAADIITKVQNPKNAKFVDPRFLDVIDKDPKKLATLFNRLWAVPAVAAASQLPEQKYGGWLNKYK